MISTTPTKCWIINIRIPNMPRLEIAYKTPVLKLATNLVASIGAGSHRACTAIFDDAGFCALVA
jgi:hypothetical protein